MNIGQFFFWFFHFFLIIQYFSSLGIVLLVLCTLRFLGFVPVAHSFSPKPWSLKTEEEEEERA